MVILLSGDRRLRLEKLVTAEGAAACAANRLGGQGGRLVADVRLAEQAQADAVRTQSAGGVEQRALVLHAADDKVGVFGIGGEEVAAASATAWQDCTTCCPAERSLRTRT
jgi:hypothetical protein